jgi:hypothetical protein
LPGGALLLPWRKKLHVETTVAAEHQPVRTRNDTQDRNPRFALFDWPLSLLLEASRLVFCLWMGYDERVAENAARAAFNNPT